MGLWVRRGWLLTLAALALASGGCGSGGSAPTAPSPAPTAPPAVASEPLPAAPTEAALLDAVFRIDVERVEAVFDVYPAERRVQAQAAVTFRMRPGQSRPIVHFEPARSTGVALRLDGQDLDPGRASDARLVSSRDRARSRSSCSGTWPRAFRTGWRRATRFPLADADGRFFAESTTSTAAGNETLFPTLNTPHELAHHVLVFRVHAAEPYLAVGSGLVDRPRGRRRPGVGARHGAPGRVLHGDVPPRPCPLAHPGGAEAAGSTCAPSRRPAESPPRRRSRPSTPGSRNCRERSARSRCRAA